MRKLQLILILILFGQVASASEVNVYTSRHYDSDDALYEEFTAETGIQVNIISGKGSALLERLKAEVITHLRTYFLPSMQGICGECKRKTFFKAFLLKKCWMLFLLT